MSTNPLGAAAARMSVCPIESFTGFDYRYGAETIRVATFTGGEAELAADAGHYMIVQEGEIRVEAGGRTHLFDAGCYGSFFGAARVTGEGSALLVSTAGYRSQTLVGGPVEEFGRLRYVDGCTTSLLLPPPVRGEPCLNFMHLPCQIAQTMHTHPSFRVGLILSGNGKCEAVDAVHSFAPGTVFFIPEDTPHSFQSQDETLRIVIYHPDSDCGPTHTDHTMLNRTFVEGQSAQNLTAIHTQSGAAS
jgi:mannose-6-phosphate isomerase-like protein (cupin superfamily)